MFSRNRQGKNERRVSKALESEFPLMLNGNKRIYDIEVRYEIGPGIGLLRPRRREHELILKVYAPVYRDIVDRFHELASIEEIESLNSFEMRYEKFSHRCIFQILDVRLDFGAPWDQFISGEEFDRPLHISFPLGKLRTIISFGEFNLPILRSLITLNVSRYSTNLCQLWINIEHPSLQVESALSIFVKSLHRLKSLERFEVYVYEPMCWSNDTPKSLYSLEESFYKNERTSRLNFFSVTTRYGLGISRRFLLRLFAAVCAKEFKVDTSSFLFPEYDENGSLITKIKGVNALLLVTHGLKQNNGRSKLRFRENTHLVFLDRTNVPL